MVFWSLSIILGRAGCVGIRLHDFNPKRALCFFGPFRKIWKIKKLFNPWTFLVKIFLLETKGRTCAFWLPFVNNFAQVSGPAVWSVPVVGLLRTWLSTPKMVKASAHDACTMSLLGKETFLCELHLGMKKRSLWRSWYKQTAFELSFGWFSQDSIILLTRLDTPSRNFKMTSEGFSSLRTCGKTADWPGPVRGLPPPPPVPLPPATDVGPTGWFRSEHVLTNTRGL